MESQALNDNIEIRFATVSDASAMREIAANNQVSDQNSTQSAGRGFIISPRTEDAYRTAIERSNHVLVAEENGIIVGQFMAHKLSVFRSLSTLMKYSDEISHYLQKNYPDDTVFMDQFAILRSHQRKGVGKKLYDFLVENTPHKNLWVATIAHKPVRNHASIAFFINRGFREIVEKQQGDWVLGIYESGFLD